MKNCRERRAGVFRIKIDLAADERAVRQVPAEIETAIDIDILSFQHLRHYFGQQDRFREVFRTNCDVTAIVR